MQRIWQWLKSVLLQSLLIGVCALPVFAATLWIGARVGLGGLETLFIITAGIGSVVLATGFGIWQRIRDEKVIYRPLINNIIAEYTKVYHSYQELHEIAERAMTEQATEDREAMTELLALVNKDISSHIDTVLADMQPDFAELGGLLGEAGRRLIERERERDEARAKLLRNVDDDAKWARAEAQRGQTLNEILPEYLIRQNVDQNNSESVRQARDRLRKAIKPPRKV